jgi:malic enzyme
MKLAVARAIASVVADDELDPEHIIPSAFSRRRARGGQAVAEAALQSGVARRPASQGVEATSASAITRLTDLRPPPTLRGGGPALLTCPGRR